MLEKCSTTELQHQPSLIVFKVCGNIQLSLHLIQGFSNLDDFSKTIFHWEESMFEFPVAQESEEGELQVQSQPQQLSKAQSKLVRCCLKNIYITRDWGCGLVVDHLWDKSFIPIYIIVHYKLIVCSF